MSRTGSVVKHLFLFNIVNFNWIIFASLFVCLCGLSVLFHLQHGFSPPPTLSLSIFSLSLFFSLFLSLSHSGLIRVIMLA